MLSSKLRTRLVNQFSSRAYDKFGSELRQFLFWSHISNHIQGVDYTAIPYRASTGPEQGFPCEVFHTGKNLFSLQGTPVLIAGTPVFITGISLWENFTGKTLFLLQGMGLQCVLDRKKSQFLVWCQICPVASHWPRVIKWLQGFPQYASPWPCVKKEQMFAENVYGRSLHLANIVPQH